MQANLQKPPNTIRFLFALHGILPCHSLCCFRPLILNSLFVLFSSLFALFVRCLIAYLPSHPFEFRVPRLSHALISHSHFQAAAPVLAASAHIRSFAQLQVDIESEVHTLRRRLRALALVRSVSDIGTTGTGTDTAATGSVSCNSHSSLCVGAGTVPAPLSSSSSSFSCSSLSFFEICLHMQPLRTLTNVGPLTMQLSLTNLTMPWMVIVAAISMVTTTDQRRQWNTRDCCSSWARLVKRSTICIRFDT
jgi:hypothetical protein